MTGIANILEQGASKLTNQQIADLVICENIQAKACRAIGKHDQADEHEREIDRLLMQMTNE